MPLMFSLRRLLLVCLASLLLVSWLAAAAHADGATTIASAPLMVYGQQQFGNTATGGVDTSDNCDWVYSSNWLLPVVAGDRVTSNGVCLGEPSARPL